MLQREAMEEQILGQLDEAGPEEEIPEEESQAPTGGIIRSLKEFRADAPRAPLSQRREEVFWKIKFMGK